MRARKCALWLVWYLLALTSAPASALDPAEEAFENASPSVVVVETLDATGTVVVFGSGVVIAPGEVITNCHVLKDGVTWRVRKAEDLSPAYVRFYDEARDLCQLLATRVASFTRPVRGLVAFDDLKVGRRVYAIGGPRGLELSLSEGIISALRNDGGSIQLIQTTASISPGSSGGGLFDREGRLVGITTFLLKDSQNLNFAVPANWVLDLPSRQADLIEWQRKLQEHKRAAAAAQLRRENELRRLRADPRPEPTIAPRPMPQVEAPRPEARPEPVLLPKVEAPKVESRFEPRPMVRAEPRAEPTIAARPAPQVLAPRREACPEACPEPIIQARPQPRPEPQPVVRAQSQPETRPQPRPEVTYEARADPSPSAPVTAPAPTESASPPVAVAPLPMAPKQTSVDENALLRRFAGEISRILGKSVSERDYPLLARQSGWQGTAEVRLQIGADGKVKNVLVGRSSGYDLLDQRAVEMVRQIRLPNVPLAFRAREFTVTIPITFALKNS